jgi:poly(A) polymerase
MLESSSPVEPPALARPPADGVELDPADEAPVTEVPKWPLGGASAVATDHAPGDRTAEAIALYHRSPRWLLRTAQLVARNADGHEGAGPVAPFTWLALAARQALDGLTSLSPGQLREELECLLLERNVPVALQWLQQAGVLGKLLPELEATVNFSQEGGRRHKDVWEHTKTVVYQSVRRPAVRWAALLHDIGKVPTRTFTGDGKVHFHGHSEVGARMFDPIARRFGFDAATRTKIRFLIYHHLRANQYQLGWTDSAVRRFDKEMGEHLVDLLDLSRADVTSRRPGRRQEALSHISQLSARIRTLREEAERPPPLPSGIGDAMMARFGLPPSRRIGEIKVALEAAIEAGALEGGLDADYYLNAAERLGLVVSG